MVAQMANVARESHTVTEANAGDAATAVATAAMNNLDPNIRESLAGVYIDGLPQSGNGSHRRRTSGVCRDVEDAQVSLDSICTYADRVGVITAKALDE
jgi:hypothetical protein